MNKFDGLTLSDEAFVPNDPKSPEQVNNVLNCFVWSVDQGVPISPEMLKFIRDGVAAYTAGDKTPWKGVRGKVEKGNPRLWAALIVHAHIIPNWNAHEGEGRRPSLKVIGEKVDLASGTDVSKSLKRAEQYLLAELNKKIYSVGRIAAEITAMAKDSGLPDGAIMESNGRFYWVTPEQKQQILDENISMRKIIKSAVDQARALDEKGGVDNLIESMSILRLAQIDADFVRYERAEVVLLELESAFKQGRITLDEYGAALEATQRKFFFCPRG